MWGLYWKMGKMEEIWQDYLYMYFIYYNSHIQPMKNEGRNGFDLDDTLIDFVPAFLKFYNEEYGTNHEKREFHNYRFWEILGGTRERMIQIVHAFHETDFAKNVTAIDGAREMIERLHNDWHENYIVTSRPEYTQNQTQAIVENIFGGHIKDMYFANHYAHHGAPKKKSEICAHLWLSSMTEDSLEYAEDCAQVSSTILLLNQPWNQQGSYHSTRIQRVRNHQEVLKILR